MRLIRTRNRTQHTITLSMLVVITLAVSTLIPLTSLAGGGGSINIRCGFGQPTRIDIHPGRTDGILG